jgi:ATP-dependent DNA helicase HFM1/MER3
MQLAPSSSPAFKARQRRAEQQNSGNSQSATGFSSFDDIDFPNLVQRVSETPPLQLQQEAERPFQKLIQQKPQKQQTAKAFNAPTVQGIQLVPTSALPDRLRTVFPFPNFNAVQSKCFESVFRSDDNFVLASPTGSGKTAILELAVCRAVATNTTSQYKIIYQAPTKAFCSERQRDWEKKFKQVGLDCAELTGDSGAEDLRKIQSANIIITTPEKWDSMTRKWKDHERLMKLVKLFLIDEVHILKDDRGAVLEAVVSRMKSIGNDVRFVALSATVPNFQDVAEWLGRNAANPQIPAANEKFGEEFRPVKLQKHVCGYNYNSGNDYGFENFLSDKLPEVIARYSERKPIMIFCATRRSTASTAEQLAKWWGTSPHRSRMWNAPKRTITASDKALRGLVSSGVAFHHAGLDINDRMQVEQGFLDGNINVICCTSTLAVGVNLPCHLVVVKNTMCFGSKGIEEYSDLEMMQMLGRAGRPQFDDSAVAVIMTRQSKARRYETLVTGQDVLESRLHLNLIEHLNAEISLGTVRSLSSARKWLTGTFLYVRLKQNPAYYKLEGSRSGQSLEEQVDDICIRDIALLREYDLTTEEENFSCTEYGHAMTRYYVNFETMKTFLGIPPKATLSGIVSRVLPVCVFMMLIIFSKAISTCTSF